LLTYQIFTAKSSDPEVKKYFPSFVEEIPVICPGWAIKPIV